MGVKVENASARVSSPATLSMPARFEAVRHRTERLCSSLAVEDYVVTAMTDASPAKWHLAHTTWFFETFVLRPYAPNYEPFDPTFFFLFNSYYVQAGERHCRAQRGLVTRPTVAEVYEYRRTVNDAMLNLMDRGVSEEIATVIEIGINHEQQHQELMLTDLKYMFYANPLKPAYDTHPFVGTVPTVPRSDPNTKMAKWTDVPSGVAEFGYDGSGFSYDNEGPRHLQYVYSASVANQLVTNEEYAEFIRDGGYRRAELWLSAGFAVVQERGWQSPLYWERNEDTEFGWSGFTLAGMQPLEARDPVCHVSYYEADAYARWRSTRDLRGARLPTEFEWEYTAKDPTDLANPLYDDALRSPRDVNGRYGTVWQWTMSPYVGYPGYRPAPGALGEYNGKFMSDQWVLRGSSIATPPGHARRTYRNFFPADARWQFSGIRLATDD